MTKQELKEYRIIKKEVEQLEEQIVFWKERKTSIKSQIISEMPPGGDRKTLLDILVGIEGSIDKLTKKITKLINRTYEIEEAIEELDIAERVLMRYRYIDNLKMYEIAQRMNFSERMVNYIHSEALQKIS